MSKNQEIIFSIIIPTFNRANMIGKAIESVLNQSYSNWELIIVDDGSIDNTKETVEAYKDDRIKYFFQENKGRSAARNFGIIKSKGNYIGFMDDDDYLLNNYLLEFNNYILNNNISISIIACANYEDNGKELKKITNEYLKYNPIKVYWNNNCLFLNTFIIHRKILEEIKFPEKFYMWEDKYFILNIMLFYSFNYLNKYLCAYRDHSNRSIAVKYGNQYKLNALNQSEALIDFNIKFKEKSLQFLTDKDYNKGINKYFYWHASKAMKNYDFPFSIKMLKKIKLKDFYLHNYYYYLILGRLLFYWLKNKKWK